MIGTKLAHYEITSHLGTGGMGEVYQATDSKLDRSVAIKLLPEAFTDDADRVARFEREARVLASLNHPNIATIHGVEESGGRKFLVMELVPGETLAEKIKRSAIPLDESLGIAIQITEALEAAHEKGVIHRDLKPANIKVTPEGKVKVLDFGLAKAFTGETVNASLTNSPTISHMATQQGLILGTAAYMSPEQAKGKEVDRRTDIFAFGVVLYEMLTGHQAFDGEDAADILSHVLRSDPDWTLLSANVPPAIRKLLRRCLEKNVKNRRGGASDVRLDIEEALAEPLAATSISMPKRSAQLAWILMFVASLFVLAMATPTYLYFHGATGADEIRFEIPSGDSSLNQSLSVSPDGRKVAFATTGSGGTNFLYERELGSVTVRQLPGTDGATSPFWSPDSQSIGFFANGRLRRIELKGGPPQDICPTAQGTATWSKNDVILFSSNSLLHRVTAGGGEPSTLTALNPARQETAQSFPQFLPDGQHYIYLSWSSQESNRAVYSGLLDSEEKTKILAIPSMAAFADPGYLLYQRQGTVFAHRFDVKSMKLTGEPVRIADHIFYAPSTGRAAFSVSQNGVLIYRAAGGTNATQQFVWVDRAGNQIGTAGEPGAYAQNFDLSLDAKQLAMSIVNSSGGSDLWVMDLKRGVVSQFTHDALGTSFGRDVVWSPDGLRISSSSYSKGNTDIVEKNASGLGEEITLVATPEPEYVEDWSKDGKYIVYDKGGNSTNEIWMAPTIGERKPFPILQTPFKHDEPHFSFDTKWLAFNSDESRTWQVYVIPLPAADQQRQISKNGGAQPRWRNDGKELYYLALDGKMMAVDMNTGGKLEPGIPRELFDTGLKVEPSRDQYAVTPNGQSFLILKPLSGAVPTPITIVVNWTAALNQK